MLPLLLLGAIVVGVGALGLMVGSSAGWAWPADEVVRVSRLERVWQAGVVGAALACAGMIYQAVLRNALADPYLLGVASGASLANFCWKVPAVYAAVTGAIPLAAGVGRFGFAFAGSLAAAGIVLSIASSRRRSDPGAIVLVGLMVSMTCGALLLLLHELVKSLPGSGYFQTLLIGELQTNLGRDVLAWATAGVVVMGAWAVLRSRWLDVLRLSDDEAQNLGINVRKSRLGLLMMASLLTAIAVALSGPVGFVGLLSPHAARRLIGGGHAKLLPGSMLLGAGLLIAADAVSRGMVGIRVVDTILPVGVLTGLIGAPAFLVILMRAGRGRG
jgi:iron complex transport system permease protein